MTVICVANEVDDGDGFPSRLQVLLDTFLRALDATTIPHHDGRLVCDVPGAVLLSEHARRLSNALGVASVMLFKRAQAVPLQEDGSLQVSKNTSVAVQGADGPEGPWTNLRGPGVRASVLEISPFVAKDLAIINRAHVIVGFPVERWNELQARNPGGPHQRYFVGDVVASAEIAVLESVRRLFELPTEAPSIKLEDQLKVLYETTPLLDRRNGAWVSNTEAAKIEGLKTESLRTYRKDGIQTSDGSLGRDVHGRVWRRSGTSTSHPWYLRSFLKKKNG